MYSDQVVDVNSTIARRPRSRTSAHAGALINAVHLYFESDGEGDPLIILHGGLGVDHVMYRRPLGPIGEGRGSMLVDDVEIESLG